MSALLVQELAEQMEDMHSQLLVLLLEDIQDKQGHGQVPEEWRPQEHILQVELEEGLLVEDKQADTLVLEHSHLGQVLEHNHLGHSHQAGQVLGRSHRSKELLGPELEHKQALYQERRNLHKAEIVQKTMRIQLKALEELLELLVQLSPVDQRRIRFRSILPPRPCLYMIV